MSNFFCKAVVFLSLYFVFVLGCCIGFENHRYFLVYCFYNAAGCIYLLYFAWYYLVMTHGHPSSYGYSHLILPIALVEVSYSLVCYGDTVMSALLA